MTEDCASSDDRHVFLEAVPPPLAAAPSSLPTADPVVEHPTAALPSAPDRPIAGSRREKGGSLWLAEQQRLRAERAAESAAKAGAKHCWVTADPRWPGRHAALLLAWVRDDPESRGGWAGRVAFAPGASAELVVAVVPAGYLWPAS